LEKPQLQAISVEKMGLCITKTNSVCIRHKPKFTQNNLAGSAQAARAKNKFNYLCKYYANIPGKANVTSKALFGGPGTPQVDDFTSSTCCCYLSPKMQLPKKPSDRTNKMAGKGAGRIHLFPVWLWFRVCFPRFKLHFACSMFSTGASTSPNFGLPFFSTILSAFANVKRAETEMAAMCECMCVCVRHKCLPCSDPSFSLLCKLLVCVRVSVRI